MQYKENNERLLTILTEEAKQLREAEDPTKVEYDFTCSYLESDYGGDSPMTAFGAVPCDGAKEFMDRPIYSLILEMTDDDLVTSLRAVSEITWDMQSGSDWFGEEEMDWDGDYREINTETTTARGQQLKEFLQSAINKISSLGKRQITWKRTRYDQP